VGIIAYGHNRLSIFFAFTTVTQIGYILMGVAAGTVRAEFYAVYYLLFYILQLIGILFCLSLLKKNGVVIKYVGDLASVYTYSPKY
jgi:NADH-quinone oxidoreductase subunit N